MTLNEKFLLEHEKKIFEFQKSMEKLKEQNLHNTLWTEQELVDVEKTLKQLQEKVYGNLSAWQRVQICRHPLRPHTVDYCKNVFENFEEIHGDRLFHDDMAIITGFGMLGKMKVMIVGQEKGSDTESRIKHNFGMPHPEGYRKALRAMQLAEKFGLPVVCLVDTSGAHPALAAEERGQGWAIAKNLMEMSTLKVPILVMIIGEGCSGGALGIGIGDRVAMLQHSYYSVISPEGCASILYKDSSKKEIASEMLKLLPEQLLEQKIIDDILEEPFGGAHQDQAAVYKTVRKYLEGKLQELISFPTEELLELRYQKYRKIGCYSIANTCTVNENTP